MSEAKDTTIIMRVSPELKEAIKVAAASENRKMSNFILTILLEHPKVKAVLDKEKREIQNLQKVAFVEEKQEGVTIVKELQEKKENALPDLAKMKHNF